jgi:hypothetical protein
MATHISAQTESLAKILEGVGPEARNWREEGQGRLWAGWHGGLRTTLGATPAVRSPLAVTAATAATEGRAVNERTITRADLAPE